MSNKMNLLIHLNGYSDYATTTEPSLNNFKWNREYQGIDIDEPASKSLKLAPGESKVLFSGDISTSADATTTFNFSLKEGSSTIYQLEHEGGTAPLFRTPKSSGSDATTEVSVSKNAKLLKFESTGGTLFSLGGVVVGDKVRIGSKFNSANVGEFTIISLTATSFTVINESGLAENNILLDSAFADQINIYSSAGIQVGDKLTIEKNFSPVSFGTYEIVGVSHNFIDIHSVESLPEEYVISNNPQAFSIYRSSKQFLYIECDKKLHIKINSSEITNTIEGFQVGTSMKPGIFLSKSVFKSVEIINPTTEDCSVVHITAE